MPEPALMFWILGAPLIVAIVDWFKTRSAAAAGRGNATPGAWSKALHVDGS